MGAEVTKLELPDGSDTLRHMLPVMGEHSLFWKVTNRGKRFATLDMRQPAGAALLLRLSGPRRSARPPSGAGCRPPPRRSPTRRRR
jgi:hypothetical protein